MGLLRRLDRKLAFYRLNKVNQFGKAGIRVPEPKEPFLFAFQETDLESIMDQFELHKDCILGNFNEADNVLIKVNLNSSLPYPASTSGDFLLALIKFLRNNGYFHLTVGDCSSNSFLPTKRVLKDLGLLRRLRGQAAFIAFEEGTYVEVSLGGCYVDSLLISQHAFEFDRIINLTNMKTHCHAGYSMAMKNLFGFLHPFERKGFHANHLNEKIAELSLCIHPDLNIIDARKFFITGGPNEGEVAVGNTVFVSNDMLLCDVEAYRSLYNWKLEEGKETNGFLENPFEMPQISHYIRAREKLYSGV